MNKKYPYKFTRLIFNLLLSIAWFTISYSTFSKGSTENWYIYITLALGILHLVIFVSEAIRKYFEVNDQKIRLNTIKTKEILLAEVSKVQISKEGVIFIKDQEHYLAIRKSQMKKEDYEEFLSWAEKWKAAKGL